MADSTLSVQAAVVAALKADAGVGAVVGDRIYDRAPGSATFPFVSLGPTLGGTEVETQGGEGWETVVTLDVWSRYAPGRKEAADALAAIHAALQNVDLSLSGFTVVMLRLIDSRLMSDEDGVTTHGVARYRIVTDA